jgi:hypothetical protein
VRYAIESGRLKREEDAVQEAMAFWSGVRERARIQLRVTLDDAEDSLARGEGRIITKESMRELAQEVKLRGRDRLAAEQRAHGSWWRTVSHRKPTPTWIWWYVAKQSGSIEIADRLIDSLTERFYLLARYPQLGRRRDEDLRPG